MKKKSIEAAAFDQAFDEGKDITQYLDLTRAKRPELEQKRVSVDFPSWMVRELDQVAKRLGVTRQSIIKVFISEKLKENEL